MPTEFDAVEGQTPAGSVDPAEADAALATDLRDRGGEYGTVTGRPRRIGWLDVPMLRHATRVSGFAGLVVGHLDVLAGLDEVRVGHRYELDGDPLETVPTTTEAWGRCSVEYRRFDGWPDVDGEAIVEAGYGKLPENARAYLDYLETELDTPVYAVGVGPGREETVVRTNPFA